MSENIILHCQDGSSDKVYIVCVSELNDKGMFEVKGKWGRRGKRFSEQVKGSYGTIGAARSAAISLVESKRAKGYVNIEDGEYDGHLTRNSVDIAKYLDGDVELQDSSPEIGSIGDFMPDLDDGEMCVAKCVDNSGIEGRFDVGMGYIVVRVSKIDGKTMMIVIDNEGKECTCYRERFGKFEVE